METIEAQSVTLEQLSRQLADFIALYELAASNIERHELFTGQRMAEIEVRFKGQLDSIHASLSEFKSLLSEMGIARWRLAAEGALKSGQEHVDVLRESSQALLDEIRLGSQRFESSRTAAILQLNEASKLIGLNEFRQATQHYRDALEQQTEKILERLDKSSNWFHWQRVLLIVLVAILSAMTATFVLTNQLPWETHQQSSLERSAGKALLKAWPHLSKEDQDYLKSLGG